MQAVSYKSHLHVSKTFSFKAFHLSWLYSLGKIFTLYNQRLTSTWDMLRPVYTGDFCRGNLMQFLSHQVSNMLETPAISRRQIALRIAPDLHMRFWGCNFGATKIASSCRDKNRLCKRAFKISKISCGTFLKYRPHCHFFRLDTGLLADFVLCSANDHLLSKTSTELKVTVVCYM